MSSGIARHDPGAKVVFPCPNWINFLIYHVSPLRQSAESIAAPHIINKRYERLSGCKKSASHRIHTLDHRHVQPTKPWRLPKNREQAPCPHQQEPPTCVAFWSLSCASVPAWLSLHGLSPPLKRIYIYKPQLCLKDE